jgi:C1A family cysteine protease
MARPDSSCFEWHPDVADHRDYVFEHDRVGSLLSRLKPSLRKSADRPDRVDWREFCGPVEDQQGLPISVAHACVGLVQQFERRASGRMLALSRLFVHQASQRLNNLAGSSDLSLRLVLKAMVRCGVPPETVWPYDRARFEVEPDSFAHAFQREFRNLAYIRLDSRHLAGDEVLARLQSVLAAGFSFAFGFPTFSSLSGNAEIPFPVAADDMVGSRAVTAVGYDDKLRIRSDKGALLVRNSWGADWGDHGFGWLPYSYVRNRLASDFWTLMKPSWLRSGEFGRPELA